MQVCLHDTSIEIYTTFQHMKGASFCIHRTCLCHWVFELPLSHLSPCSAIHFIFLSLGMDALSPPQRRLCRLWVLSLHYVMCAMTRMSEVVIYKFNNPPSTVLHVLSSLRWFPLVLELVITQMSLKTVVCNMPTFLISLFSTVAPSIHEMKSHGVVPGRTALLRCEAAAVPSPTFEWFKGEKRWAQFDCLSCLSWSILAALPSCQLHTYSVAQ